MFHRLGILILAAAVFAANAYCACAAVAGASSPQRLAIEDAKYPPCHGPAGGEQDDQQGDHHCDHCNGTRSLATPAEKSGVTDPLPSAPCWAPTVPVDSDGTFASSGHAVDHSGPSPPVPPQTLLHQSCSFNL